MNGLGTRYRISGMREGLTEWSGIKLVYVYVVLAKGSGETACVSPVFKEVFMLVLSNYPVVV